MRPEPFGLAATACVAIALLLAPPIAAQPFHARGSFHAGGGAIWDAVPGNLLHDDGLHDDGAAGDGVWAGVVVADQPPGFHQFKIATPDWSQAHPTHPSFVLANAVLYTFSADEQVKFRIDTNALGDGWQPAANAVACSHFTIPTTTFEVIGSPPELGSWNFGVPATLVDGTWVTTAQIATPGDHEFKFRVTGTWDVANIGIHYNMFLGDNFSFSTAVAGQWVRFEFNTRDGRARAVPFDITAAAPSSWGRLKALYR